MVAPSVRKKLQAAVMAAVVLAALGFPLVELIEHIGEERLFSREWYFSAGAPFGTAAIVLFSMQFVIAARFRFLDRIFPLNRQFLAHRFFGCTAFLCALAHPLIMFWPAIFSPWNVSLRHWPELIGAVVLLGLGGAAAAALFRERLRIPFHLWLPMHRAGTIALAVLVGVHVAVVEGHVEFGAAHLLLAAALAAYLVSFFRKGDIYTVKTVRNIGRDTTAVDLAPRAGSGFSHAPGQFALVTFCSEALPRERHPWTISSAPSNAGTLQFTIRKSGDFTSLTDRLRPGDSAFITGPYGQFSPAALGDDSVDLVMVAGGVGITPFLSMLRYMADTGDRRRVVLIWSTRTQDDILLQGELDSLKNSLHGLEVHRVFTRQDNPNGCTGRLNGGILKKMLSGMDPEQYIFICGPPAMASMIKAQLQSSGFSAGRIVTEEFRI